MRCQEGEIRVDTPWKGWLNERFGNRPALSRAEAIGTVWAHIPQTAVEECFAFFAEEYGLDPGVLRSTDLLSQFTTPIRTKNPFRWLAVEPQLEDRASELNYRIVQQAERYGKADEWLPVETLDDYFRVWAGIGPAQVPGSAR